MKRSEMIAVLADLLEVQRRDLNNGSDYQDAIIILNAVNGLGMLPPFSNPPATSRELSEIEYAEYYKWEPEND